MKFDPANDPLKNLGEENPLKSYTLFTAGGIVNVLKTGNSLTVFHPDGRTENIFQSGSISSEE